MPSNDADYQRKYKEKHYAANKERYIEQAAVAKRRLRKEVEDLKRKPCSDCKVSYPPWVMDFDHRPGEVKVASVAVLVNRNRRKAALAEIEKCDLVCANCHRERTHSRGYGV